MANLGRDHYLDEQGLQTLVNELETNLVALEYSTSATYAVDDYCVHNNKMYRCTTAISTAESWNSDHWKLVIISDELKSKKSGTVTSVTIKGTSPIVSSSESAITTSGTRTISHANSGVTAGTYKSVTVNATGHVTAGSNPTTLSGYGITDAKIESRTITLGSNSIQIPTITDTYSGTSSNGMSGKAVKSAIDALDGGTIGTPSASKTLTALSQTNGNISATFGDIAITNTQVSGLGTASTKDVPASGNASTTQVVLGSDTRLSNARTPTSHTHGNIQNGGTLQTDDITIASGDKLVVTDSSDSAKVARTSISFDGSTTTKALTPKGTFETFLQSHQTVTDNNPTLAWGTKSKVATIGSTDINVTMPANPNTDTKVRQTLISDNNNRPLIMSSAGIGNTTENVDSITCRNNSIYANPSTGRITSKNLTVGISADNATFPNGAIKCYDVRNVTSVPTTEGANFIMTNEGSPISSDWYSGIYVKSSGGEYGVWELVGPALNADNRTKPLYVRSSNKTTAWGDWRKIYDSSNPPTASEVSALPNTTKYAASSSVGGSATSAVKLDTATAGTLTKPCYFTSGKPTACTYELNATVPENAVFTDTKVTAVGNHYIPSGGSAKTPTGDTDTNITNLSSGSGSQVISGVTIDAAGHVTGLTSKKIRSVNTTYANGTGITIGAGNAINHSNSVTAQTTQKVYPIKIDAQGHISAYGTSPTTLSGYGITDAVLKSGDTMTGDLAIKVTSAYDDNSPSKLTLQTVDSTNSVTSTGVIYAFDGGANGVNFVIRPGGNLFLGSGEAAYNHYTTAYTHSTTESTFITSDGGVHIQAHGQTIANRVGMQIDNSGNLVPEKADVATNNIGGIGTSTYKWANGYFTNINGVAVGDSPKFTDTIYTGTGLITVNSSTHVISTTAEANQNAFSTVKVGSTNVSADTTTDTLTLAGSNVTLTPDATNDKVTIGITSSNVTTALGYTPYDSTNPSGYTSNIGTITKVTTSAGPHSTINISSGNVSFNVPTVPNDILAFDAGNLGIALKSGDNVDTLEVGKTYYSSSSSISGALTGTPPTTSSGFKIITYRNYSGDYYNFQFATKYMAINANTGTKTDMGSIFFRYRYYESYGKTYQWSDWYILYTSDNLTSKTAASAGTAVSLVTTGEKYTWNNKSTLALGETSSTAYRGDRGKTAYTHATDSSRLTTATSSGLYKVASTAEGHIASLTAVAKADITGLGIPASDTQNTAGSTNTTSKIYLVGTTDQTTGTNSARTYSDVNVYTTNGTLTSSKTDTKAIIARTGSGTAGSTSETTPKYTPTKWTFNSGITVANGEVYFIKIPKAGGTYGVWCSLNNGTNYYPVAVSSGKGRFTTHYAANTVIAVTYESAGICTCYPLAGGDATSDVTGIFRVLNDYDANTNTYVTQTATNTTNANYEVLFSATADNTTRTEGARKASALTYNPSTGLLSTTSVRASTALEVNNTTTNASQVRFRFSDLSSSQYATLFATRDANYGGRLNFRQYSENSSGTLLSRYENYQLPKTAQGLSANKTYTIVTTKNLISGSSITVSDSSGDVTLSIPDTSAPTYTLADSQPNEWSANGLLATRWGNVVQVVLSLKNKSSYTYQAGSIGYAGTVTGTYMPARPLTLIGYSGTTIFMGWFEKTSETTGTIEVKGNINTNLSVGQTITVTGTFVTNTNT